MTRVLVDTSVWIDFLNGHESPEATSLVELIEGEDELCTCGVIVSEVFQGLRRDRSQRALRELFSDLTFLDAIGIELYFRAAEVYRLLRERGHTIRSTIDCLIATVAEAEGCFLLARDRDMVALTQSGLANVLLWRGSAS
jgi:predicted nucleic acid-binding protein